MIRENGSSVLVGGNWTFGQVAAKFAMQRAIESAKTHNISVAAIVQTNHIGRLGHYPEMAADAGMISMVWSGGLSEETPATMP